MLKNPLNLTIFSIYLHELLSCLTYIGSVLFRTSAYIGAKQASRVPAGSKQDSSVHNDDGKDISVLLESELIGSV